MVDTDLNIHTETVKVTNIDKAGDLRYGEIPREVRQMFTVWVKHTNIHKEISRENNWSKGQVQGVCVVVRGTVAGGYSNGLEVTQCLMHWNRMKME